MNENTQKLAKSGLPYLVLYFGYDSWYRLQELGYSTIPKEHKKQKQKEDSQRGFVPLPTSCFTLQNLLASSSSYLLLY